MEIVIGYIIIEGLIAMGKEMFNDSRAVFIARVIHGVFTYE